ncbi:MAG: acyl-CoA thioesterase [Bacteroidetes bacterium]|nr:MAG: acyl-CoA thioesterase [Bacteroidota bacterium]
MMVSETQVRVRYAETDQMGFVYYGNYASYYEVGRTEALRSLGSSYHKLEETGVIMPVVEMSVKYLKSAKYDDLLTIRTRVPEVPDRDMVFEYEIYNNAGELLNKGKTTLVFISKQNGKRMRCPEWMQKLIIEANHNEE